MVILPVVLAMLRDVVEHIRSRSPHLEPKSMSFSIKYWWLARKILFGEVTVTIQSACASHDAMDSARCGR